MALIKINGRSISMDRKEEKFQKTVDLLHDTNLYITENAENYTRFLRSAAWTYKYRFNDQVLIYFIEEIVASKHSEGWTIDYIEILSGLERNIDKILAKLRKSSDKSHLNRQKTVEGILLILFRRSSADLLKVRMS